MTRSHPGDNNDYGFFNLLTSLMVPCKPPLYIVFFQAIKKCILSNTIDI